jgi:CubicO group peptidase (beta-lactamase class C family)
MNSVGALMLYEQDKLLIDDPLSKYFPKFASMRVVARDANGEPTTETVPANRQTTIQHLMRHISRSSIVAEQPFRILLKFRGNVRSGLDV